MVTRLGYFSVIIALLSCCTQISSVSEPSGGALIDKALRNVLGRVDLWKLERKEDKKSPTKRSTIRKRCSDKLACEYQVPYVELDNVMFKDGEVYLSRIKEDSKKAIDDLNGWYAQKNGHLPSLLAQTGEGRSDWVAGPKINLVDTPFDVLCPKDAVLDTSAYFIFPWEANNAFHSLNDNLMSVVSNLVLQYVTAASNETNIVRPRHRTLYTFAPAGGQVTLIYKLLKVIFEGDIQRTNSIMTGGPYCFKHITWGTTIKLFYRDSLMDLRRVTFDVLKEILHLYVNGRDNTKLGLEYANTASAAKKVRKAVVITRQDTKPADSPARKLAQFSEQNMIKQLAILGYNSTICCDYSRINTVDLFIDAFLDVDICIGLHGAGLSNCILGASGMIMIEFQMQHAYGFDSFMKIAHMAQGQYIFYDVREARKHLGKGPGSVVEEVTIEKMLDLATKMWSYSQRALVAPLESTGYPALPPPAPNAVQQQQQQQQRRLQNKGYVWQSKAIDLYNHRKHYINAAQYQGEIIVNFADKSIYFHQTSTVLEQSQKATLLQIFNSSLSDYKLKNMNLIQANGVNKVLTVNSVFGKEASIINDAGSNMVNLVGPQVFWLMLNPYNSHGYTLESILGPKIEDNFNHCVSLPYYKFRTMTTNFKEHRGECDKKVIFTRRTGGSDGKLTQRT